MTAAWFPADGWMLPENAEYIYMLDRVPYESYDVWDLYQLDRVPDWALMILKDVDFIDILAYGLEAYARGYGTHYEFTTSEDEDEVTELLYIVGMNGVQIEILWKKEETVILLPTQAILVPVAFMDMEK